MQYNKSQAIGWSHLTEQEKSVLTLIVVNGRSKQEASVILNLSYYKFNEIYSRARKFFIMFKEYWDTVGTLVPEGLAIDPELEPFLHFTLKDRKTANTIASSVPGLERLLDYREKKKFWNSLFESFDDTREHQLFKSLLLEFDRWNSFRILPKHLRKPSPYLRRRNNELKKLVTSLTSFSSISWEITLNRFKTSTPPFYYVPQIILLDLVRGVGKVKKTKETLDYFSANGLPIWESETKAQEVTDLIFDFKSVESPNPFLSHKFWAEFRLKIMEAVNFKRLLQIEPGEHLDFTMRDKAFLSKMKSHKSKKISIKPHRDGADFWV